MPLGIYLSHANAKGSVGANLNFLNSRPNDETATAIAAELGVVPRKATVMLAYRMGDNGKATNNEDNSWTLGGTFKLCKTSCFS